MRQVLARLRVWLRRSNPESRMPTRETAHSESLSLAERLAGDVKYALRGLRRAPAFATTACLALAIGIGANTAIFSLVHAVLLRPLPYADPNRIVQVADGAGPGTVSPPDYVDWRDHEGPFAGLAAYEQVSMTLVVAGDAERVTPLRTTSQLLPVLGIPPVLGTLPGRDGDAAGGPLEVVLSHAMWRNRFSADSSLLGGSITLDGRPYTVRAVMPPGFTYPVGADPGMWISMALTPAELANRGAHFLTVVGRLAPSQSVESARAAMDVISERLGAAFPRTNANSQVTVTPLAVSVAGDARPTLLLLWGAVGFVLLIATANVAGMQLTRAAGRRREMAMRMALGADSRRIVPQLITESLVLAALGGVAGLAIALVGVKLLTIVDPGGIARFREVSLNPAAFLFTLGVSLASGIAFGIAPALSLGRTDVHTLLQTGTTGSVRDGWYRSGLVVTEVALALVLLVGAGLLTQSLRNLVTTDPGLEPQNVLTMNIDLPRTSYPTPAARQAFFDRILAQVTALPDVLAAGAVSFLPMAFQGGSVGIAVEGVAPPEDGGASAAVFRVITPDYFEAMGIALRDGRAFGTQDNADAPAAIINEAMAQRWWPDVSPVGRRIKAGRAESDAPWLTIVGIVADVRQFHMREASRPEVFIPVTQPHAAWLAPHAVVVKTRQDPLAAAPAIRAQFRSLDPLLPVSELRRMTDVVGASTADLRFHAMLLFLLGATALTLAGIGIYGVIAYGVSRRHREFGVRLAVGARPSDIVTMVVRQGMRLTGVGLVIGVFGALALTRFLAAQLYEIGTTDAATLVLSAIVLLATAAVALAVPARRAARVDPVDALRGEA